MDPEWFGSRQVSRMRMVGCDNPDMVQRSLFSLATAVEDHLLRGSFFLLGIFWARLTSSRGSGT